MLILLADFEDRTRHIDIGIVDTAISFGIGDIREERDR